MHNYNTGSYLLLYHTNGMVICLQRGADCLHMVQLMPLHPKSPSFLASFKARLVLSFWYRLTQVVLEKRPLNGCSSSSYHTKNCEDWKPYECNYRK